LTKKETHDYLQKQEITPEFTTAIDKSLERIEQDEAFFVKFLGLFLASHADIRKTLMKQDLRILEAEMRQALQMIAQSASYGADLSEQQIAMLDSLKGLQLFYHKESVELWKRSLHQTLIERDPEVTDVLIAQWLLLVDRLFDDSVDR
jgi:hypothetical protein